MASSTLTTPDAAPDTQLPAADYVLKTVERTRRRVRTTELARGILDVTAVLLVYLFAMVVADHWFVGLAGWARSVAFVSLICCVLLVILRRLVPPLGHRIHPIYAARAIERSSDSSSNSLVNFLFLRPRQGELQPVIYQAIERQAASDLAQSDVDAAVDRMPLIRVGYLVAILTAMAGLYCVLSPKSSWQSMARILAPWADIERPTRVKLETVAPGDAIVYYGQQLKISATVRDLAAGESVQLLYSTTDGLRSGVVVPMLPGRDRSQFACQLELDGRGIAHDLVYWIVAGDARSRDFYVTVRDAPTILVQRLKYEYPAYTGRPAEIVEGTGDITALEGSRVTIYARANHPIRTAYLELGEPEKESENTDRALGAPKLRWQSTVPMEDEGNEAAATITLTLGPNQGLPQYVAYRARFLNQYGDRNPRPIEHRIHVLRDVPPVVEVLQPADRQVEVPENGQLEFHLRAVDPDFRLERVTFHTVVAGQTRQQEDLPLPSDPGQVLLIHRFRPSELGLVQGTVATCWATAADNRTAPLTGQPEPNVSQTPNFQIRIIVPESTETRQEANGDRPAGQEPDATADEPQEPSGTEQHTRDRQQSDGGEGAKDAADRGARGDGSGEPTSTSPDGQAGPDKGESGDEQPADSAPDTTDGQESSGARNGQGSPDSATGAGRRSPSTGRRSPDLAPPAGDHEGESPDASPAASDRGDSQPGAQRPSDAQVDQQGRDGQVDRSTDQEPVPSDGTNDGEAVERVLKHLKERGATSPKGGTTDSPQHSPQGGDEHTAPHSPSQIPRSRVAHDASHEGPQGVEPQPQPTDSATGSGQQRPANSATSPADSPSQQPSQRDVPGSNPSDTPPVDVKDHSPTGGDGGKQNAEHPSPATRPPAGTEPTGAAPPETSQTQQTSEAQHQAKPAQGQSGAQQEAPNDNSPSGAASTDRQHSEPSAAESEGQPAGPTGTAGAGTDRQGTPAGNDAAKGTPQDKDDRSPASDQETEPRRPPRGADSSGQSGTQSGSNASPPSPTDDTRSESADGPNRSPESPATGSGPDGTPGGSRSGGQGSSSPAAESPPANQLDADEANLEYARATTNLVLEYLKSQRENPDEELLEQLGWTRQEMAAFVSRWEQLHRDAAQQGSRGEEGERRLDDVLRSLGLKPPDAKLRSRIPARRDAMQGMSQSGRVSEPPQEYRDQYRAYLKSARPAEQDSRRQAERDTARRTERGDSAGEPTTSSAGQRTSSTPPVPAGDR